MSQHLAELCSLLVEDNFGSFFAHVFSVVAQHGQSSAPHIAQRCRLPLRQIRHGLSVLVQAHLVYHRTPSDGRTAYRANLKVAYDLLRAGSVVQLVRLRVGSDAALLIADVLSNGQTKIGRLRKRWLARGRSEEMAAQAGFRQHKESQQVHNEQSLRGGQLHDRSPREVQDFDRMLKRLAQDGYILRSRQAHLQHPADILRDSEASAMSVNDSTGLKGRNLEEFLSYKAAEEARSRTDASIRLHIIDGRCQNGLKPFTMTSDEVSSTLPRKKVKLGSGAASQTNGSSARIATQECCIEEEKLTVSVNRDKIVAILRNLRLIAVCRKRMGASGTDLYSAVLGQFSKAPFEWQKTSEPTSEGDLSTGHVATVDLDLLLIDINTREVLDDPSKPTAFAQTPWHDLQASGPLNGYTNGTANGDSRNKITLEAVQTRLSSLAQDAYRFVLRDPDTNGWIIDFGLLGAQLWKDEVLRYVRSRYRGMVTRVIRALFEKGKMDEKSLQEICLLTAKELRQCLLKLKGAGMITVQEVPREAQRLPNRTMYLWSFSPDRARKVLLKDLYKSMARLLRRSMLERGKLGRLVGHSQGSGMESTELRRGDSDAYNKWSRKAGWLIAELARLDESVCVLRDL